MGTVCCTELEDGKLHERAPGSSRPCGADGKEPCLLREPMPPAAVDSASAEVAKPAEEEELFAQKQRAAAAKIQANFRGNKTRDEVSQLRNNIVVQHHEDPEVRNVDPASITLQSKPNRMSPPAAISPRTLAQFNGKPMRNR
mmetsp:Transcript_73496/g.237728  ORF Transcript_73496/g.237728 Transcript_73496/m.237728 type:complete len:142 (-) Transcript_73496:88-513(-)